MEVASVMNAMNPGAQENVAGRLARIFPGATPMRIPVRMEREAGGTAERTMIEFGTAREVIFRTSAALDCGDSVRLLNDDGTLDVKVRVIAVQWMDTKQAVAAHFIAPVSNWIIKQ
jgi:hypothetical protein